VGHDDEGKVFRNALGATKKIIIMPGKIEESANTSSKCLTQISQQVSGYH
jgi:hypothetical protein